MATVAIGTIGNIQGSVEVVHTDGSKELVQQGATVYADDAITTGENATARIEFLDGSSMLIGPEFTAALDEEVFDPALLGEDAGASQMAVDATDREITPSSGFDTEGKGEKVATIEVTVGVVEAIDEDGNVRVLQAGDALYANDILRVGADGDVSITLVDGSLLSFGPGEAARMVDVGSTSVADVSPSAVIVDPAQIAAIIQEGRDPTQEAAAPAAGPETVTGNEGVEFTVITPSSRQVTPGSGHETHGFELPFNIPETELFLLDTPAGPSGLSARIRVDEDDLARADGDLVDGIPDFDTDLDEATFTDAALQALISAGTVGPVIYSLNTGVAGNVVTNGGVAVTSGGTNVVYNYNAGTGLIEGKAGAAGPVIFTLTDNGDKTFTFDLLGQIDNTGLPVNDDNEVLTMDLTGVFIAKDAIGNPVALLNDSILVDVENDLPDLTSANSGSGVVTATVHEDALSIASGDVGDLSEGIPEGQTLTDDEASGAAGSLAGLVTVADGADEVATLTFGLISAGIANLPALQSKGDAVSYGIAGNVLTATAGGRPVFTLTVNANGSWDFDLDDQLDHKDANGDNGMDLLLVGGGTVSSIDFSAVIEATLTDFDKDTDVISGLDAGDFTIVVKNDIPDLTSANSGPGVVTATVHEDALSIASGDVGDLSEGIPEGQTLTDDEASGAAGSLAGLVTVADGADEVATLTFGLISAGIANLPALQSKGDAVSYGIAGNVLTATAGGRPVFTLTVNANGSWDFDLDDQLDHKDANGDNGMDLLLVGGGTVSSIDFSAVIEATLTDFDKDTDVISGLDAGDFTIVVKNDIPDLTSANSGPGVVTATVHEDALSIASGDVGDLSEGIPEGQTLTDDEASGAAGSLAGLVTVADGADEVATLTFGLISAGIANLPALQSKGDAVSYGIAGNVLTATAGGRPVFTLTVNANGSWDFDLDDQLDHKDANGDNGMDLLLVGGGTVSSIDFSAVIEATLTDFDKDTDVISGLDAGDFTIVVKNDIPDLTSANSGPGVVTATVHEDALSIASGDVGDLSEGIPEGQTLTDDEASGAAGSLAGLVTVADGADEVATLTFGLISAGIANLPALQSKGDAVSYGIAGNVLTATAGGRPVFTLTVNANGSWDFDLDDQLDHKDANGDNGMDLLLVGGGTVSSIDFSAVIEATLTDFDKDTDVISGLDAGDFTIVVKNDIPDLTSANSGPGVVTATVHEDALSIASGDVGDLSEGIPEGQTLTDDEASGAAGSLAGLVTVADGADEVATLTFGLISAGIANLPALQSKGDAVSYGIAGNVLTATAGGRPVFTLTVNANGSWDFDLDDQLDHKDANGDNGMDLLLVGGGTVSSIDFSAVIEATLTDFDKDTDVISGLDAGDFTIVVKNDIPIARADTDKVLVSHTTDGNVLTGVDANDPDGKPDLNGIIVNRMEADDSGADEGVTVTGVMAGDTGTPAVGNINVDIVGTTLGGTLKLQADGDYEYEAPTNVLGTDVFTYTITDADGDTSTTTLSIDVGGLIIGSNSDDDDAAPNPNVPHVVPRGPGDPSGTIQGADGDDVLVGDPGGSAGIDANVVLVLDASLSMLIPITFGAGTISRQEAQKNAVNAMLDKLEASDAANIRVHLVEFSTSAKSLGTFNIIENGVVNTAQLAAARTAVGTLGPTSIDDQNTNYEAGLQQALHYIDGTDTDPNDTVLAPNQPLVANGPNDVNQLLFVSDGLPNRALLNDSTNVDVADVIRPSSSNEALAHLTGSYDDTSPANNDDTVNEIVEIESRGFTIEAVGINVSATGVAILSQVEGAGGAADNITTAEQLSDVLDDLTPIASDIGADIINGGDGDDIIFGDVLNTDQLTSDQFGAAGTHNGQGYAALVAHLEDDGIGGGLGVGNVDNIHVMDFIKANLMDLAADDRGKDDTLNGGAGNDILIGQGGNDTFLWLAGDNINGIDTITTDTIADFRDSDVTGGTEEDVLNIADLLVGEELLDHSSLANLAADLDVDYISITPGASTKITIYSDGGGAGTPTDDQVVNLTGFNTIGMSSADVIESLLNGGNLVTD